MAQALYRIYYSQDGYRDIWAQTDKKVKKIMYRCVEKKIETLSLIHISEPTRH